ncbi:sn-glycerol-1-phosphate dehydrogenase [Pseudopedobacter beijingensis]|uniref:Sn-glycerol-1-phosphate dehydrogenase n=1 Tax=Pseudopedobacter beijingensis TaxID=1207056 RepID=A0ABW4ID04_9SPHI
MSTKVERALKAASETKDLLMGSNVLDKVPELFKKYFAGHTAVVVADQITYEVAGKEVVELLKASGINQEPVFIFTDPELYAEYSFVEQLSKSLATHNAIAVAVGSGTINDLAKLASHQNGREYMCVATAASMDGYTAFGASITADGAKQTFNCPAPKVCVADIEIIRNAPTEMTASGYADLFAKITAGADWILADRLGVEPIDDQAWSIVQDGLHDALSDPKGVHEGDAKAVFELISGLMLGGFAMQWSKSSRPASGAEHQFSHLWNMEHHTNNGEHISHGFQVAIGTLAITALYEEILKYPFDQLDIEACCAAWPSPEVLEKESRELFKGTDFPEIGDQETKAKYIDAEALAKQLQLLKANWTEIREKLKAQMVPFNEAKNRLKMVGAPYEPEHIGVTKEYLKNTFVRAQYIRRRFTVLDLLIRTNTLDFFLDKLFGKNGVWALEENKVLSE